MFALLAFTMYLSPIKKNELCVEHGRLIYCADCIQNQTSFESVLYEEIMMKVISFNVWEMKQSFQSQAGFPACCFLSASEFCFMEFIVLLQQLDFHDIYPLITVIARDMLDDMTFHVICLDVPNTRHMCPWQDFSVFWHLTGVGNDFEKWAC